MLCNNIALRSTTESPLRLVAPHTQANVELAASKAAPPPAAGTAGAAPVFDPRLPAISVATPSFDMGALAGGAAHADKVAVRATTACN